MFMARAKADTRSSVDKSPAALRELVRRRVGQLLREQGLQMVIDPVWLASELVDQLGADLAELQKATLRDDLLRIANEELLSDGSHVVTRLLWMWKPTEADRDRATAIYSDRHGAALTNKSDSAHVHIHQLAPQGKTSRLGVRAISQLEEKRVYFFARQSKAILRPG